VVVVSTDFGGGGLHDLLELPDDFGLATVVAEHVSAMTVVHSSLDTPNLMVLQAGPLPGGTEAADLLAMPESDGIFGELSAAADLVIVVSPPVLGSAVAATVAKRANAVVLVVRAGLTRRADLRAALEAFAKVGAPIVGVVFHERRSRRTERGSRDVLAVGWAHPPERTKDAREEQVQVR
jgi:Mrp family chromosome partitioning ATPase